MLEPVLIDGVWTHADSSSERFHAFDPVHGVALTECAFPVSDWPTLEAMLAAGMRAAAAMRDVPASAIAAFLRGYADAIEADAARIVASAHRETGLPIEPRLAKVELPRTTFQLRQAATEVERGHWCRATIDSPANIRSMHGPLGGPVLVFGPNNFPLAFNGIAGGDFAAAIAAGNPVIAKANPAHPATSALLADAAARCAVAAGLPRGMVQMFFHTSNALGLRLAAHPNVAAIAFTGSRRGGLALKEAADKAGKPIYLEMSSVNPVFVLAGALRERAEAVAAELHTSCTLAAGQFCTKPGLAVLAPDARGADFVATLQHLIGTATPGVLLAPQSPQAVADVVTRLLDAGAELLAGGDVASELPGYAFRPTLLSVSATRFLQHPDALQSEAFGPVCLLVRTQLQRELLDVAAALDGSLTGSIYSDTAGSDDADCDALEVVLRPRVGRLLNDRMPTGVAVSAAMNHGGPYPATGHPGFTAVGFPAAMMRFSSLRCYDNVRHHRLPPELQNRNPTGALWRLVDGEWTTRDIEGQPA